MGGKVPWGGWVVISYLPLKLLGAIAVARPGGKAGGKGHSNTNFV